MSFNESICSVDDWLKGLLCKKLSNWGFDKPAKANKRPEWKLPGLA
jgi:hypothetical protein